MKVMQSFRRTSSTTNPYLTQLVQALPPSVETILFSWRQGIVDHIDVLHLHWPENLLRGTRGPRALMRFTLFALLMMKLSLSRTAIVRTLHNERAHEPGGFLERQLLRWCDRNTDLWIALNPYTAQPAPGRTMTILHGHYREWFNRHHDGVPVRGRLLVFGLIRPYKGIDRLLVEYRRLDDPKSSLHIAGRPISDRLASSIELQASADSRVKLDLKYLSDCELADAVSESELVVLPYREMHNSGAVLLALSLDRPVLVPRNDVTLALQAEVGDGWVHTFSGDLDASDLTEALSWASRRANLVSPDLSLREWGLIGMEHAVAYELAIAHRHGRRMGKQ